MDEGVEAFLADVLALEGENPDAIRDAVRTAQADCEAIFRAQEANRRMKDESAHACHSLRRARILGEMRRRKGTPTADHLKLVLSIMVGCISHRETTSLFKRVALNQVMIVARRSRLSSRFP
jgi:hypothetical protein